MEEILKKDIFNDQALLKLSPDYNPTDVILRLQTRRSLVKHSYCHRIKRPNNSNSRINTRKLNDDSSANINQELTKLKSHFQSGNLKNYIEIKKCNKLGPKIKNKKIICFEELSKDSDIDENENNDVTTILGNDDPNIWMNKEIEDDICIDFEALKINGTGKKKPNVIELGNVEDEAQHKNHATKIGGHHGNSAKCVADSKDPIGDLQNLLIQMAITSYSNKEKHEGFAEYDFQNESMAINENSIHKLALQSPPPNKIEDNNIMSFLKIEPIKEKLNDREKQLLQKYTQKWKKHVENKKESFYKKRQTVLDNFFDKLEKRKNKSNELSASENKAALLARDYKTYQHRYKVQRHIIALQKAKLEEQNRMIDELKYNKIVEASKLSVDAMKEEVRKTYYEMDRQLKPKMKCLTNELKLHEIEEPSLVLHCLKVPQFLQRMEKRAREREEKHAIIRERRQQMEEERVRLKQQAELAKTEMDKEEKMQRIKELKEKRIREKMESIRKKQHAEKMRALIVMADLHYEKNLKNRLGLQPLKSLLEIKRLNTEKAQSHYKFQVVKNFFLHWMWYAEDQSYERNFIANSFYRKKILRKAFDAFKTNHHALVLKKQVAEDYYDFYVVKLVFRKFREGIAVSQVENSLKMHKAIAYYNSNQKFKILTCWRTLPALNALKREQEARKSRWREKVLQVVPDYAPPED